MFVRRRKPMESSLHLKTISELGNNVNVLSFVNMGSSWSGSDNLHVSVKAYGSGVWGKNTSVESV